MKKYFIKLFILTIGLFFAQHLHGQSNDDALALIGQPAPLVVTFEQGVYGNYSQMIQAAGVNVQSCQSVVHPSESELHGLVKMLGTGDASLAQDVEQKLSVNEQNRLRTVTVTTTDNDAYNLIKGMPNVVDVYVDEVCVAYGVDTNFDTEPLVKANFQYQFFAAKFDLAYQYIEAQGYTYQGTTIGVVDTGIWTEHPDIKGAVIDAYILTPDGQAGIDLNGHGSHVAGILGMRKNGTGGIGGFFQGNLIDAQALGANGAGFGSWVNAAVYALINDERVDMINMSLGPWSLKGSEAVIQAAKAAGKLIVIATGNNGRLVSDMAAASHPDVLAVGAYDKNFNRSSFSNYHPNCVFAGGNNVISIHHNQGNVHTAKSGTSMSDPTGSSEAALLIDYTKWWAIDKGIEVAITPNQYADFIRLSCDTINNIRGINAYKAVKLLEGYLVQTYLGQQPEPELALVPVDASQLEVAHYTNGNTFLNYQTSSHTTAFEINNPIDGIEICRAAANNEFTVGIDTAAHKLSFTINSGLSPEQEFTLAQIEAAENAGTSIDYVVGENFKRLFGLCDVVAGVVDGLIAERDANLNNWSERKIRRIERVVRILKIAAKRILKCQNIERSKVLTVQQQAKINQLFNQIIAQ